MRFFFVPSAFGWRNWFYLRVGPLRVSWNADPEDGRRLTATIR